MKTHILKNKSVYPTVHAWVSSGKPKINVYSSKVIMPGDKIEFEGRSFTVEKTKQQAPTDSKKYGQNISFYELDLKP